VTRVGTRPAVRPIAVGYGGRWRHQTRVACPWERRHNAPEEAGIGASTACRSEKPGRMELWSRAIAPVETPQPFRGVFRPSVGLPIRRETCWIRYHLSSCQGGRRGFKSLLPLRKTQRNQPVETASRPAFFFLAGWRLACRQRTVNAGAKLGCGSRQGRLVYGSERSPPLAITSAWRSRRACRLWGGGAGPHRFRRAAPAAGMLAALGEATRPFSAAALILEVNWFGSVPGCQLASSCPPP
jgi:hypothetical protein